MILLISRISRLQWRMYCIFVIMILYLYIYSYIYLFRHLFKGLTNEETRSNYRVNTIHITLLFYKQTYICGGEEWSISSIWPLWLRSTIASFCLEGRITHTLSTRSLSLLIFFCHHWLTYLLIFREGPLIYILLPDSMNTGVQVSLQTRGMELVIKMKLDLNQFLW